jgi:acetyl esterase/lipase
MNRYRISRGAIGLGPLLALQWLINSAVAAETSLPPVPATVSEAARAQLAAMAQAPAADPAAMTLEQMRGFADQFQVAWSAKQKAKYAVTVKEDAIAGVPVRIISPSGPVDERRILIDLHGGGFEIDSGSLTENVPIAALTGITVVAVRYRMSPEHPFPAAVDDALAVYRVLLKSHEAKHIAVYGTSAGAVLGPELIARIRAEKLPPPGALGMFSGDTDFAREGDSLHMFPFQMGNLSFASIKSAYAGATSLTDPLLSPWYAGFKAFPPTLCITSGRDFLLSSTVNFCRQLELASVPAHLVVYDGLPHAFWTYIDAPETDEAFQTMADFLIKQLGGRPRALVRAATAGSATDSIASCQRLAQLPLPDTTITSAEAVAAGPFKGAFMGAAAELPPHCRVVGIIAPEPGSKIGFEVWMPLTGWNGRLYGAGNGGFGGAISYTPGLVEAVQRGGAGVSTDTGHRVETPDAAIQGGWAKGHPELLRDYGYRALHLSTLDAKALITAMYQRPIQHAYFTSCSNGGREALMEAQRFPEDYDGIIAGAPALDWTGLAADIIWNDQAQRAPGAAIPASKVPALQAAVLHSCAAGHPHHAWLDDPRTCRFDPTVMLCSGADNDSCLTAPQIAALRKIYAGPKTSAGRRLYPGFPASGSELGTVPGSGWDGWLLAPAGQSASQPKYAAVMVDSFVTTLTTDYEHFDLNKDYLALKTELAPVLDATQADLKGFAARGGKLILWHGWADPGLPPQRTIDYFNAVRTRMNPPSAANTVRLFMAPGVQHCLGGPGGAAFGQFTAPPRPADPRSDMTAALERWVESGVAPEELVARHADNPFGGALDWRTADGNKTNLLCAYPKKAKYQGHGNPESADSYRCSS